MTPQAHLPTTPAAAGEEAALLAAVAGMLRDKRRALMEGDVSAQALAPLWQPLLDRLAEFAALRADGRIAPADAALRAQADALRVEYDALQHSLQLWSDAVRLAHDKSQRRPLEPVYGAGNVGGARGSLGRG